jgi:predicted transcriptional regulator
MTAKEKVKALIDEQPDDSTYEEIMRELKFAEMVERGLSDAKNGRVISHQEMGRRIETWLK